MTNLQCPLMWLAVSPVIAIAGFFAIYYAALGLWILTEGGNNEWYYPRCKPDVLDKIAQLPPGEFDLRDVAADRTFKLRFRGTSE